MTRVLSDSKELGIRGEAEKQGDGRFLQRANVCKYFGGACSPCDAGKLAYNISGHQRLCAPQHGKEVGEGVLGNRLPEWVTISVICFSYHPDQ